MSGSLLAWHDFYLLIGSASATLIGLTFVAASVGAGAAFDARRAANWQSFLTPTVLHFSAVLMACLIALSPLGDMRGALLLGIGLTGAAFGAGLWRELRRQGLTRKLDATDRLLYLRLPLAAYALLTASSVVVLLHAPRGLSLMALALVLLLALGIRNAWDMTIWIATRRLGD